MQASWKALILVPLLALISEVCEDPAIRTDISHIVFWHRVLMFIVGVGDLAVYGHIVQLPPHVLSRWMTLYAACFFLLIVSTRYLAR